MSGGSLYIAGVECRHGTSTKRVKMSQKDLVTDLTFTEGEHYEFCVSGKNKAGHGKPCKPISITAQDPWDKPGPPSKPTVTNITATEATIEWSPPEIEETRSLITSLSTVSPEPPCG